MVIDPLNSLLYRNAQYRTSNAMTILPTMNFRFRVAASDDEDKPALVNGDLWGDSLGQSYILEQFWSDGNGGGEWRHIPIDFSA